jgi:gluconolactonase
MIAFAWIGVLALSAQASHNEPGQEFFDLRIERMAGGYRFADGPVWTPEKRLLFTELPSNTIYQWIPGQKIEPLRGESNGAQGLTFDPQDRLYICESRTRRVVRQDKKGKIEVLAEKWEGKRLNGPNDIVVRKDGNVYFTDSVFGSALAKRELDFNGIFHISPKGELSLVAKWQHSRPNGIALSPNGRLLYVSSSDDRKIVAFDLDKNGAATNEHAFVSGISGVPGGIRCDEKGNLYLAANGVQIFTHEGKKIRDIELAEAVSNLAFGEGDLQTLFVTTHRSLFRIRVPYKGSLPYFSIAAPTLTP